MSDQPASTDSLQAALQQVLAPLARLALARGMTHAGLDELLRQALVEAADVQHAALPAHRRVSRIATTTGLHRREVTRLVDQLRGSRLPAAPARSLASELFHHWRTDPAYAAGSRAPGAAADPVQDAGLPRSGPAPSFESLAQHITRDVHPRSLLDELVRLGLAEHDPQQDTVRLLRDAFVPQGDENRLLPVLGRNLGAHFEAAVDNVLLDNHRHLEQALYADGLSEASIAEFRSRMQALWQQVMADMVPVLQAMVARDEQAPPGVRHRIRLGLYTHAAVDPPPAGPDGAHAPLGPGVPDARPADAPAAPHPDAPPPATGPAP